MKNDTTNYEKELADLKAEVSELRERLLEKTEKLGEAEA